MNKLEEFITEILVLDTETTGINNEKDEIIEFSASIPVSYDDKIENIPNYTKKYKPSFDVPPEASAVHFISTEDLENCELFKDDISNINELFSAKKYYVGHNVTFDRDMLVSNIIRYTPVENKIIDKNNWICTLRLAKKLYAEDESFDNLTLTYLWYKFGLYRDISRKINAHSAEDDVFMCLQVLKHLVNICIERGHIDTNENIGEQLIKFINSPVLYKVMPFGKHKGMEFSIIPQNYLEWMIINSDILNETMPNYDPDLAATFEHELNIRLEK